MLTKDNFKDYVGFQEGKSIMLVYMLSYKEHDSRITDNEIQTMSNDQLADRLIKEDNSDIPRTVSLDMTCHPVHCTRTLEEVLKIANDLFDSFPKTNRGERYAQNQIAFKSRRGVGNKRVGDVVVYKGTISEYDCCMVIAKGEDDLYGIAINVNFLNYGFVLDGGSKI